MRVLSFDISTAVVGYSLFDDGILIRYGFIDLSRIESQFLFSKIDAFFDVFDFPDDVTQVRIEESLKRLAYGSSTIDTIIILSKFNSALSFALYKKYNIYPKFLNCMSVRKEIGIMIPKKAENKKEIILNFIDSKFNLYLLTNKKGNIDSRNFDVADAIVLGVKQNTV